MNREWIISIVVAAVGLLISLVLGVAMHVDFEYRLLAGAAFIVFVYCAGVGAYWRLIAHQDAKIAEFRKRVGDA